MKFKDRALSFIDNTTEDKLLNYPFYFFMTLAGVSLLLGVIALGIATIRFI